MIIKITQIASNIKQEYDIDSEGFHFHGTVGNVSILQPITLSNASLTVNGVHQMTQWRNYIPFRLLFGIYSVTRKFCLSRDGKFYGKILLHSNGYWSRHYEILLTDGSSFQCYDRAISSFHYISIYQEEKQIALVETHLRVQDYKYTHKLYLLDEFRPHAETLSFFVLYFASYHFTKRFHMTVGSVSEKSWTFSRYNDRYDPNWRETHFPEENFFGKTHLFD